MAQVSLTLPDGNSRDYDAGVTPAEVAASIKEKTGIELDKRTISMPPLAAFHSL